MSNPVLLLPAQSRRTIPGGPAGLLRDALHFVQEDVGLWTVDEADWTGVDEATPTIRRLERWTITAIRSARPYGAPLRPSVS